MYAIKFSDMAVVVIRAEPQNAGFVLQDHRLHQTFGLIISHISLFVESYTVVKRDRGVKGRC